MEEIKVTNVKCGGCAATIHDRLTSLSGVDNVTVEIQDGVVRVYGRDLSRDRLEDCLRAIGYPPRDS